MRFVQEGIIIKIFFEIDYLHKFYIISLNKDAIIYSMASTVFQSNFSSVKFNLIRTP